MGRYPRIIHLLLTCWNHSGILSNETRSGHPCPPDPDCSTLLTDSRLFRTYELSWTRKRQAHAIDCHCLVACGLLIVRMVAIQVKVGMNWKKCVSFDLGWREHTANPAREKVHQDPSTVFCYTTWTHFDNESVTLSLAQSSGRSVQMLLTESGQHSWLGSLHTFE